MMAKVNIRQQKRQREIARKQRQDERLLRRGERPVEDVATVLTTPPVIAKPPSGQT
jgi:hypothetical protein